MYDPNSVFFQHNSYVLVGSYTVLLIFNGLSVMIKNKGRERAQRDLNEDRALERNGIDRYDCRMSYVMERGRRRNCFRNRHCRDTNERQRAANVHRKQNRLGPNSGTFRVALWGGGA